jgi:threonylcarbamoyladenosine tRNA methylthiotransferase MtaB
MKVTIKTLGCKVNQAESATMEGLLRAEGFEVVDKTSEADICIVNTCTVTAKSDAEARRIMRQAARSGVKVIATGCYAQLRPDELSKIEGVELVIGNAGKANISDHLKRISTNQDQTINNLMSDATYPLEIHPYYSKRSRGFLKIQDGCNFSCSYCTIPMARGKSRSLHPDSVMKAVEALVSQGFREIVLTGIHIGSYGSDLGEGVNLLSLLTIAVKKFPSVRFRLSSIEPHEFRKEYIDLMKSGNVCAHLHIPLQSGSDRILRLMKRGYTTDKYQQIINGIFTEYPEVSIGADIIVGFPGETDNDFNSTVKLINDLPLSYLHVFPFSMRPGTAAAGMSDLVSPEMIRERVAILRKLSEKKKKVFMTRNIGKILDVIVEKWDDTSSSFRAISGNYLRVFISEKGLKLSDRLPVKVKSLTDSGLMAEIVD